MTFDTHILFMIINFLRRYFPNRLKKLIFSKQDLDILTKYKQNSCYPPGHYYSPIVDVESIKTKGKEIWPEIPLVPAEIDLNANHQVELLHNANIPDAIPPAKTYVFDYRYQATNSRTKFNHATYELNAGDQFKPDNDPKLLAEAKHWLKHGPGYDSYKSKRKIYLAGMLITALIPIGLLLFRLKHPKQL